MLRINGCEIRTVQHPSELKCGPRKSSYFEPATREEIDQIVEWCQTLPNGSIIYVRGRDLLRAVDTCLFIGFKDWDYGFAVKTDGDSVFFLWPDQVERFRIREINFFEQLHFQCSHEEIAPASPAAVDSPAAVLLCHGFCPEHGPDYPLINVISMLLKSVGYTVIVPDFRSRYGYQ